MGCTWKEQISWAWFLGDAIIRIRTCFGFPAEGGIHELLFLCIEPIWCPSQTAWMPLFPLPALPLESARYLGQTFSEDKIKVFVTTFVGWVTFIEVRLQQQDFSQLCLVWVNIQTHRLSSFPQTKVPKGPQGARGLPVRAELRTASGLYLHGTYHNIVI